MKPWLVEALKIRAAREAEKAERKARGPRPRQPVWLVCGFCRQPFAATRSDAKFCSSTCRSIARHRRERENLPVLKRRALRRSQLALRCNAFSRLAAR